MWEVRSAPSVPKTWQGLRFAVLKLFCCVAPALSFVLPSLPHPFEAAYLYDVAASLEDTAARLREHADGLQTRAGPFSGPPRREGVVAVHGEQIDLTGHSRSPRRCGAVRASGVLGGAARHSRSRSIPRRRGSACERPNSTFNAKRCHYAGNRHIPNCLQEACYSVWTLNAKPKARVVCEFCLDWMVEDQMLDNDSTKPLSAI